MTLTLQEILSKLADQYDEVTLLELLNITSYDLVEAFMIVLKNVMNTSIKNYQTMRNINVNRLSKIYSCLKICTLGTK